MPNFKVTILFPKNHTILAINSMGEVSKQARSVIAIFLD